MVGGCGSIGTGFLNKAEALALAAMFKGGKPVEYVPADEPGGWLVQVDVEGGLTHEYGKLGYNVYDNAYGGAMVATVHFREDTKHAWSEDGMTCTKCGADGSESYKLCVPPHAHDWDERDYCRICNADGRA